MKNIHTNRYSHQLGTYPSSSLITSILKPTVMSAKLRKLKKLSALRRQMMAKILGFSDVHQLRYALNPLRMNRQLLHLSSSVDVVDEHDDVQEEHAQHESSTLLEETTPFIVHNDYCQHFIDTGQRPQNFIRNVCPAERFGEFPKLKELIHLKDELVYQTATTPMFLKCNLDTFNLQSLNIKFDVMLVEPPLEDYQLSLGITSMKLWNWQEIMDMKLDEIADYRSFIFLWCGSGEGLDKGRECLQRWGFRRCEDICWIQTNSKKPKHSKNVELNALLQRTKEHCLMGIKGTVRRSIDGDFIHCNIDTDLIVTEENEHGSIEKPNEIFNIIEHFCLGKRRLHLFGRDSSIRPGWLTLGHELSTSNFNSKIYNGFFNDGQVTVGCTKRIEELRPKSPPCKRQQL